MDGYGTCKQVNNQSLFCSPDLLTSLCYLFLKHGFQASFLTADCFASFLDYSPFLIHNTSLIIYDSTVILKTAFWLVDLEPITEQDFPRTPTMLELKIPSIAVYKDWILPSILSSSPFSFVPFSLLFCSLRLPKFLVQKIWESTLSSAQSTRNLSCS